MAGIKKIDNAMDCQSATLRPHWWAQKMGQPSWANFAVFPIKSNINLSFDLTILLLDFYIRKIISCVGRCLWDGGAWGNFLGEENILSLDWDRVA